MEKKTQQLRDLHHTELLTPTYSTFYAIITHDPQSDSCIHICTKPRSSTARTAFHALAHFLWLFFTKIRRSFDLAFETARQASPALERALWKGEWMNQDIFNMNSFRKCSRIEFRFIHSPGTVDSFLDDIVLGTHWVEALKWREGLSLEMKFREYGIREDGLPGPLKEPDVHLVVKRANFHQCEYVWRMTGSEDAAVPLDGYMDWFRLELKHSPINAFPFRAWEVAYGAPEDDEDVEDFGGVFRVGLGQVERRVENRVVGAAEGGAGGI